jgi:inorganic triphosphatase YgiF
MGSETELKFRVAKGTLASLIPRRLEGARTEARAEKDLDSTYYDTRKHKLQKHGLSLRVRAIGDKRVQTVKASGGGLARGEWETAINGQAPDLDQCGGTPLEPLLTKKLHRKLKPVFQTAIHRTVVPIQTRKSLVELAVDRGHIVAGRKSLPLAEIELELKKGDRRDLFRLARQLGGRTRAQLDLRSKAERGYSLTEDEAMRPSFAARITLDEQASVQEAFQTIALSTIRHFSGNADAVQASHSEGVHQMRVGLRRLRAALSLFKDVLPGASTERVKSELKWLTNELGPARELDVFVKEMVRPTAQDMMTRRGARAIERDVNARRAAAYARARKAVESARFRALLLDIMEWVDQLPRAPQAAAKTPIIEFAPAILKRRVKKARKQGRQLEKLAPEERHKLRIKIKKIRYGLTFFESLYSGKTSAKKLEDLSAQLKKIQSALGALNDFVVHRKIAADAALAPSRDDRRARAFASGVIVGKEQEATKALVMAAARSLRRLHPPCANLA